MLLIDVALAKALQPKYSRFFGILTLFKLTQFLKALPLISLRVSGNLTLSSKYISEKALPLNETTGLPL
jgi:hypothetical protein